MCSVDLTSLNNESADVTWQTSHIFGYWKISSLYFVLQVDFRIIIQILQNQRSRNSLTFSSITACGILIVSG